MKNTMTTEHHEAAEGPSAVQIALKNAKKTKTAPKQTINPESELTKAVFKIENMPLAEALEFVHKKVDERALNGFELGGHLLG